MKTTFLRTLLLVALVVPLGATAQGRGRTDGPEGSEIGKGGYDDPFTPSFSLQLDWGAALVDEIPGVDQGSPLFIGATGSFWYDDWLLLDVSGHYVFANDDVVWLAGPRFRSSFYPLSFWFGLKAGALLTTDDGTYFALSPQVGADFLVGDVLLMGLGYALDVPFGTSDFTNRVFLNLGLHF